MSKKLLFLTAEGIGNVIQCLPILRTLKEVLEYDVTFYHMVGSYAIPHKLLKYISANLSA